MLVQVAFLIFGLFGVLALIGDIGYVRLTRVQMQNAADSASLEGLRKFNVGRTDVSEGSDPFVSDCRSRGAARSIVDWTFDDDFAMAADTLQLGAGPNVTLTGGVGDMHAQQTIVLEDPLVYKPSLQRNQEENAAHGDMARGRFGYTLADSEDAAYSRPDFALDAGGVPPGASGLAECPPDDDFTGVPASGGTVILPRDNESFLVRLRRTNNAADLDEIPSVSSRGEPLPLVFGRAATIAGDDPNGSFSVRRDGLTVRGTAITTVRPALRIGPFSPLLPGLGAVPFAIAHPCWDSLPNDLYVDAAVDVDGTIRNIAQCPGEAGRFVCTTMSCAGVGWRAADVVAQALDPDPVAGCWNVPGSPCLLGFVALYQLINGVNRVVGFGRIAMCGTLDAGMNCLSTTIPGPVKLLRLKRRVAVQNATAHLPEGFPSQLTSAEIAEIMTANRSLAVGENAGALLVPVLAR
jgi:hypothetical protein